MKVLHVILFAILTFSSFAADLETLSGEIYKNYSIDKPDVNGLVIFHDNGITTVPYADLPKALQEKYKEEAEQAEQTQKWQMELQKLNGLFGYYLGGEISDSEIIRKHDNGSIVVKTREQDFGVTDCVINLTDDGKIYSITKAYFHVSDPMVLLNGFKEKIPKLRLPKPGARQKTITLRVKDRLLEIDIIWPFKRNGKLLTKGIVEIQLVDESIEPLEKKIFKRISQRDDDMQHVTWMHPITDIEYERANTRFIINPYVGKFDSGNISLRLATGYFAINQKYSRAKWIFYEKIQLMNERGDEVVFSIDHSDKSTEVEEFGLQEWADILVDDKLLVLQNSKMIKVRFYGKYDREFQLTDEQCQAFNDIINLYLYLKAPQEI